MIAPLVNERATSFFQASRGLRQGFSLSLLMYAIQASVLILKLKQARIDHELIGIRIVRGTKDINQAEFVDNTILLGGTTQVIARRFKTELDVVYQASGSKLNLRKIKSYSWNINPREMYGISCILGIEGETIWDSFRYLGVPIFNGKSKASNQNLLIEKIKKKIHSWGTI